MPDFFKRPTLLSAWAAVAVWVLAYGLIKVINPDGLDIDSAEQVYFAQSWQMGYGTRQPPLYTWLLLSFKPAQVSWVLALEFGRYLCLLIWLGGGASAGASLWRQPLRSGEGAAGASGLAAGHVAGA